MLARPPSPDAPVCTTLEEVINAARRTPKLTLKDLPDGTSVLANGKWHTEGSTPRHTTQSGQQQLLGRASQEGLQEDLDTASRCFDSYDAANKSAAHAQYRHLLLACLELMIKHLEMRNPPMAVRKLQVELVQFKAVLDGIQAGPDNQTSHQIDFLSCLKECQKLDMQLTDKGVAEIEDGVIMALVLMLEQHRNVCSITFPNATS